MRSRRPPAFFWLAGLSILPMLVWWLGWYPGFASSDTIDQWRQGLTGDYLSHHPPIHTLYLEVASLGNTRPGLVSLLQILALAGLLTVAAKRLIDAGVPQWLAVGAAWLTGLAPAVATMTLSLWKDAMFGLLLFWAWTELLYLTRNPAGWNRPWPPIRLGLALAGVWTFRGNGPITVILLFAALAWIERRKIRRLLLPGAVAMVAAFTLTTPLGWLLGVRGPGIDPAQVFLPDVAASFNSEPETFTKADLGLITDLAPVEVWEERYDCFDSTPLLFDPSFDHDPLRGDRDAYRGLVIAVALRDPDSVLEHRLCAANFLYWPAQPADAYFHRPPYDIPANDVGLTRDPLSERAFAITDAVWRWGENFLWLMWRPAIVLLPALLTLVVLGLRKRTRHLLIPGALFLAHYANAAITSPAQELRYAYPLYLVGMLTIPLLWLAARQADDRDRVSQPELQPGDTRHRT